MRKKTFFLVITSFIIGITGCKKVSDRKLDGEWKVVSGSINTSSTNSGGTTSTETSFDGATISGSLKYTPAIPSTSNVPSTTQIETPTTIEFTFDKKTNEYTKITSQTTFSETAISYYTKSNSGTGYIAGGFLDRKSEINITTTEKGIYRITGGTGDIKKNSQIMLIAGSVETVSNYTYSYFTTDTETPAVVSDKYKQIISGLTTSYELLSLNLTESITSTTTNDKNNQAVIWTVNELKKGSMDISYSVSQTTTLSSTNTGNTTNTETVSYKLSEK